MIENKTFSRRRYRMLRALKLYYNRVYSQLASLPDDEDESIKDDLTQELTETNHEITRLQNRIQAGIDKSTKIMVL